jgi:hypothetical protein
MENTVRKYLNAALYKIAYAYHNYIPKMIVVTYLQISVATLLEAEIL